MATSFKLSAPSEDVEAHLCNLMSRMSITRFGTAKIGEKFRNQHLNKRQTRISAGVQCSLGVETVAPACFSKASSTTRKRAHGEAFQRPQRTIEDNVTVSPSTATSSRPSFTVHVFHDSNLKGVSTEELGKEVDAISGGKAVTAGMILHLSYTLPITLCRIKETAFGPSDLVIINIMTNHARLQLPVEQVRRLLTATLDALGQHLPPGNITLYAAPPLNVCPYVDVGGYNRILNEIASGRGVNYVDNPLRQRHLDRDGFHVQKQFRRILYNAMAATIARICSKSKSSFGTNVSQ